ncbi:pilus assembly protein PilP [Methylophilus medardicus]|uniref:Pilus assembly protein PilP n=1 Tax=Methylophilus medardicus TaxID=2588534 RepID=A0A5B8CPN7_9PROT|nr:pilus assembly protein PilP [Methylophilus medardicus]QDC43159.1 pilus assembly protein PilP [Methylophilus medardicus]QDC48166.1 pilus assembly protein PilP [Methylophilus medardicus]QDC51871.1 pilus assembly protein PilP [Methylophilus medardicus]
MIRKQSLICLIAVLLSACGAAQNDDLTQFMNQADQAVVAPVEPLPEVQGFSPRQYNADNSLHDPFVPRKAAVQNTNQPDLKRTKEPLEAYPLESLKFVGVMSKKGSMFATIQTPDSMVYQVKPGSHLGEKFGVITALAENSQTLKYELKIKESIQDPVSGEWAEQLTTLELQEHQ